MAEPFELIDRIGRGGMGVIWRARDTATGAPIAVKMLHPHLAEEAGYLARFEREVEVAMRIDSPNVVRIYGFGRTEGIPYMVMELVEGPSLRQMILDQGVYGWPEAKKVIVQVLRGLEAAHRQNVIHRDIKPSNILLGWDGTAKIADFGVARAMDLTALTAGSTMLGTPAYMAPEGEASVQADLYAVGCVLFEMLTGHPPYEGSTQQEVLLKHIRQAPDLQLLPPGEARNVVAWLMAKNVADRPPSAAAALGAIEGTTPPPPAPKIRPGPPGGGREQGHRRLLVGSGLAVVAVLLVAGGLSAIFFRGGDDGGGPNLEPALVVLAPLKAGGTVTVDNKSFEFQFFINRVLYYESTVDIEYAVKVICPQGETGVDWQTDIQNEGVGVRTQRGKFIRISRGRGLAVFDGGRLPCGDQAGAWVVDFPPADPPASFQYTGPDFTFDLPPRHQASPLSAFQPLDGAAYRLGDEFPVSVEVCARAHVAPSSSSPLAKCSSAPGRLSAGPVTFNGTWWALNMNKERLWITDDDLRQISRVR